MSSHLLGSGNSTWSWWLPRGDRVIILNSLQLCCWGSYKGVLHPGPNCTVLPELTKIFPVLYATLRYTNVFTPSKFCCFHNIWPYSIIIIIIIEFSHGGNSHTSTDKTNKNEIYINETNTKTQYKQYKTQ